MGQSTPLIRHLVLVVEDEPILRMAAVDFVEDAGFDVVEAKDADEAVRILESRTDIRIILTDIDMPGSINGLTLAAYVRDRWPPIDIVIVSGQVRPRPEELPSRSVFFSKPYDDNQIGQTLRNFVDCC